MQYGNWLKPAGSALALVLTLACSTADAQVKSFKISGEGAGPVGLPLPGQPARPHWIVGEATHLGRHYGEGSVQTDSAEIHVDDNGFPTHITGEFGSGDPFVFVAADGDELACHYGRTEFGAAEPGSFELTVLDVLGFQDGQPILLVEAVWLAEFVPQPDLCTGRFSGISGSWTMLAWSEPFILGSDDPVYYAWEGEGELEFANGVPIKGASQDVIVETTDLGGGLEQKSLEGAGEATLLGSFTRTKEMLFDWNSLTFEGTVVFTAADGDELYADFAGGPFSLDTGLADGTYTFTGGTGRFAGASGEADFTAFTADLIHIDVEFEGSLTLAAP